MPRWIQSPTVIEAVGNKPKTIEEFAGRVNTADEQESIARMISPPGWTEPGQSPAFQEWSLVLHGTLRIEYDGGIRDVTAGQAVVAEPGEWVRYSTPTAQAAEYIAICLPTFSPDAVHRDTPCGGRSNQSTETAL